MLKKLFILLSSLYIKKERPALSLLLWPAPGRGLRQVARQDALKLVLVRKLEVEASTLSVSYTITIGRYYYKHKSVFLCSRI